MPAFTTRPEIRGTFGAVASTHWLASAAGDGVLENGGNAFDAAAAAGFALQVVEPHLNGPARRGADPAVERSPALRDDLRPGGGPAAATIGAFRDLGLDLIPGTGLLAAACPARSTPGCVSCATTARCRSPRFLRRRSAMPGAAIRWSAHRGDDRDGSGDVPHRMAELGRGLSAGRRGRRCRGGCSATRRSRRPMSASCARPRRRRRPRRADRARPRTPGRRASSPRRSSASAAREK